MGSRAGRALLALGWIESSTVLVVFAVSSAAAEGGPNSLQHSAAAVVAAEMQACVGPECSVVVELIGHGGL